MISQEYVVEKMRHVIQQGYALPVVEISVVIIHMSSILVLTGDPRLSLHFLSIQPFHFAQQFLVGQLQYIPIL